MLNRAYLVIILLLVFSCVEDKTFEKKIWQELQKEEVSKFLDEDSDSEYHIMVLTDKDCAKCYDQLEQLKDTPEVTNIAMYYSRNQKVFLSKLTERNPKIRKVPLNNLNIITQLQRHTNRPTPIRITIFENEIKKIE